MPGNPGGNSSRRAAVPIAYPKFIDGEHFGHRAQDDLHGRGDDEALQPRVLVGTRFEIDSLAHKFHPLLASEIYLAYKVTPQVHLNPDRGVDKVSICGLSEVPL